MRKIYVLTEWNENGCATITMASTNPKEVMSHRLHTLKRHEAIKVYGNIDDNSPYTTIDIFTDSCALYKGIPDKTKVWY